jgi:hypothetical protein
MSNILEFPLQFQRQYAGPLDKDSVFATTADRMSYLTNARRYAGQPIADLELGKLFLINATKDAYIPIGGNETPDTEVLTYADMLLLDTTLLQDGHKIFVWDASGDPINKITSWAYYRYNKEDDKYTVLSKGDVTVDLSNYYTKPEVDDILKNKAILPPVPDLLTLKALDTTDAKIYPDKWVIFVDSLKSFYTLDRDDSTSIDDGEYIIAPTTGAGRWIKSTEQAFKKGTAFNKNFGTGAGTVSEGNHTHDTLYAPKSHSDEGSRHLKVGAVTETDFTTGKIFDLRKAKIGTVPDTFTFALHPDLDTSKSVMIKGTLQGCVETKSSGLVVSYEVRLDSSTTATACATIIDVQAWIDANIGTTNETTLWWLTCIATSITKASQCNIDCYRITL